jgi:hypothetical protein
MVNKKDEQLPEDSMVGYSPEGVPISKKIEHEAMPPTKQEEIDPPDAGFTGGAHNKKRQGTEDAQKRSDTGTGL